MEQDDGVNLLDKNHVWKARQVIAISQSDRESHSKYFIEIMAADKNTRYFKYDLIDTLGNSTSNLFILPAKIDEKPLKFTLGINANSSGQHEFAIKSAKIISHISN